MSRKTRQLRIEAEERWPTLQQFLASYCHEDWPEFYGTPENALNVGIAEYPLKERQQFLREWRDWNMTAGAKDDVRDLVNVGFGVNIFFKHQIDARHFMNMVYDKMIVSVREETSRNWQP